MKVLKLEQKEKNVVRMEIEVDAPAFEDAMQRSYIKNVKKLNIPGFRKGRAPKKFIEKYYGEGVFYDDAINFVCPEAYDKAVEENGLDVIDRPEIEVVKIQQGEPFVFGATVTVRPEVKLGQYKGVSAVREAASVSGADVDGQIGEMREKAVRITTLEKGAKAAMGDTVSLDFEGFVDGAAFEGGKGEKYALELGSNSFIPGFEEQLVGIRAGEEKTVEVTFPKDYHSAELAGKAAVFKCSVSEIKHKELPELDDEFAKDVSEFDTLADLKADIKAKLLKQREESASAAFENAVLDKAAENIEVEIPDCMVQQQIDKNMQDVAYRMQMQGLSLENYLSYTQMSLETFREQLKPEAEKTVKTSLMLSAVAKAEGLGVSDSDVENELKSMAEKYSMELDKVKETVSGNIDAFKSDILMRKTVNFLTENAVAETAAPKKAPAKRSAAETPKKAPAKKPAAKKTAAKKETAAEKEE